MTSDSDHTVDGDSTVESVVVGADEEPDEETRERLNDDGTLMDTREVVDSLLENE